MPPQTLDARFWAKVATGDDSACWEWQAFVSPEGYGYFWDSRRRRMVAAHRIAYELTHGPLAEKPTGTMGAQGEVVCHRCDNRCCVNPAHLFLGSQLDNMRDCFAKERRPPMPGANNGNAKLTPEQVTEIRASVTGRYGERSEIARRYGISTGHVSKILNGSTWT